MMKRLGILGLGIASYAAMATNAFAAAAAGAFPVPLLMPILRGLRRSAEKQSRQCRRQARSLRTRERARWPPQPAA